jgi:hypothetical protein
MIESAKGKATSRMHISLRGWFMKIFPVASADIGSIVTGFHLQTKA